MQDNALVERVCELGEAGISVIEIDKTLHREQVTRLRRDCAARNSLPLRPLRPPQPQCSATSPLRSPSPPQPFRLLAKRRPLPTAHRPQRLRA